MGSKSLIVYLALAIGSIQLLNQITVQSQPLTVNSPSYVGCWGDWTLRDLYIWFTQIDNNTNEACVSFCLNSGYIYAGTQG